MSCLELHTQQSLTQHFSRWECLHLTAGRGSGGGGESMLPLSLGINTYKKAFYSISFKQIAVVHLPLGSVTYPLMSFRANLQSQMWIPSREAGLNVSQKVIGCPHQSHIATVPVGASSLVGQHCAILSPQLSSTADGFSPSAPHIAPSSSSEPSQAGGIFCFTSYLISLGPISKVYGVFALMKLNWAVLSLREHYFASC